MKYTVGSIMKDSYFDEYLYGIILPRNIFKTPKFTNGIELTTLDILKEVTNIFI